MKIYWVTEDLENPDVKDFMYAHRVEYIEYDQWDKDNNIVLPPRPFLLICTLNHLRQMNDLHSWIAQVNACTDSFVFVTSRDETHVMKNDAEYDAIYRNPRFYATLQGIPHDWAKPHHTPVPMHVTHELRGPQQPLYTHHTRDKDYLALMRVKANPSRTPHRTIIYEELKRRDLLNNYAGKFIDERLDPDGYDTSWPIYPYFERDSYMDERYINSWQRSSVSLDMPLLYSAVPWDMYNSANFEIVCETLFTKFSGPSEKTWKPINAQMPFLVASDEHFYEMLWSYGFKTFGEFVDESWHNNPDLEARCMGLVNTAQHIIETGSSDFYRATREVCRYNYLHAWSFNAEHKLKFWEDVKTLFDKFGIDCRIETGLKPNPPSSDHLDEH